MSNSLAILLVSAASIGFLHTLLGPDHYLPFVVMSRANNWSIKKTALITVLCGLGHVGSSIILGALGLFLDLLYQNWRYSNRYEAVLPRGR